MANLGSSNTPISGESFDLPSGWSFEENVDGEVIITDSGGTTIGRRDETNGKWVFDSIVSDTLEATDSIIDPEGNTVTSLSDPVRVTEEASTFAESDVTVTNNNTTVSNGSIELSGSQTTGDALVGFDSGVPTDIDSYDLATFQRTLDGETVTVDVETNQFNTIDNFEDNNITTLSADWDGWNGDTGALSAQNSTVISGSYSGKLISEFSANFVNTVASSGETGKFLFDLRISSDTGDSLDSVVFGLDSGNNAIIDVKFEDSTRDIIYTDETSAEVTTGEKWSPNTTYTVAITFDFDSNTYSLGLNGNEIISSEPFSFGNTASSYDKFVLDNDASSTTDTRTVFFDNIEYETFATDIADIGKNFDISSIDTSKNVKLRANLSRKDTANNPTVDYLARRFTR